VPGSPSDPESSSALAFDYDRTVALSDGVFAIALTLLVLTISFPSLSGVAHGRLGSALGDRFPQFLSYALSFAVLAYLWIRHHVFFRGLERIDTRLTVLNLAYMAFVAFLPYPTRLLGEYGDQAISATLYASTLLVIAVIAGLMRLHATRARVWAPSRGDTWLRQLAPTAVFLVSIPVALLVSATAAEWLWVAWVAGAVLLPRVRLPWLDRG
jgi:uncharacterized membrane protein